MEVVLIKKEDNYIELSPQPFRYISKFPLQTQTNKGGSGLTFRYKEESPVLGLYFILLQSILQPLYRSMP